MSCAVSIKVSFQPAVLAIPPRLSFRDPRFHARERVRVDAIGSDSADFFRTDETAGFQRSQVLERRRRGNDERSRINYKQCNGQTYQYVYAAGIAKRGESVIFDTVVKFDLAGDIRQWQREG